MSYDKTGMITFISKVMEKLKGKWIAAISSSVILAFLVFVIGDIINLSPAFGVPVIGFMALGEIVFMRKLLNDQNAQLEDLFKEYKSFIPAFLTTASLVILLGVGFVLLIVPGILLLVTYTFTLHILEEDKTIGTLEALERSKEFTKGYRGRIGIFYLIFFLAMVLVFGISLSISLIPNLIWGTNLLLIAGIIAGILQIVFISPLFYASITMFYDELKNGSFKKATKKVKVQEEEIETVEAETVKPEEIEE